MAGPQDSPFVLMTRLGNQVGATLSALDIDTLDKAERKTVEVIRRLLADARLDTRDYELSETRAEQLENAKIATERIQQMQASILAASEHGMFSAIDVAQLSAELDEIVAYLR